jgi:carbonic anhydrase
MNKNPDNNSVIETLVEGYKSFYKKYFEDDHNTFYRNLVEKGQAPKTMIIACSDSRVDPATVLGCSLGEVFVVRNVANLVPPCENDTKHHGTSAALEFAVCFLKVEHIIIFGHSHCGGIRALLSDFSKPSATSGFISSWMDIALGAKQKALDDQGSPTLQEKHCCEYSLINSLHNLTSFPWIAERVRTKELTLHAWHFDLETGNIRRFNPQNQCFENLVTTKELC